MNFDYRWQPIKAEDEQRIVADEPLWQEPFRWHENGPMGHQDCYCVDCDGIGYFDDDSECKRCGGSGISRPRVLVLSDLFEDWLGLILDSRSEIVQASTPGKVMVSGKRDATMSDVRQRVFDVIDRCTNIDWYLPTQWPELIRQGWLFPGMEDASDAVRKAWSPHAKGGKRDNVYLGVKIIHDWPNAGNAKRAAQLEKCRDLCAGLFLWDGETITELEAQ